MQRNIYENFTKELRKDIWTKSNELQKKKMSKCKTIFFKIFTSNISIKLIIETRLKYIAINIAF